MKDNNTVSLGLPPATYDYREFTRIIRQIEIHLQNMQAVGPIRVSAINISHLPTSPTGLRTGDLWNDGGTVKIV